MNVQILKWERTKNLFLSKSARVEPSQLRAGVFQELGSSWVALANPQLVWIPVFSHGCL